MWNLSESCSVCWGSCSCHCLLEGGQGFNSFFIFKTSLWLSMGDGWFQWLVYCTLSQEVQVLDLAVSLCCVLGQNTLLSWCLLLLRNLKGYQWIVREAWWNARGLVFMKGFVKNIFKYRCSWMDFSCSIWNCIQKYYLATNFLMQSSENKLMASVNKHNLYLFDILLMSHMYVLFQLNLTSYFQIHVPLIRYFFMFISCVSYLCKLFSRLSYSCSLGCG